VCRFSSHCSSKIPHFGLSVKAHMAPAILFNKPNRNSPYEHITHVGGPNGAGRWKETVPNVVRFIEEKTHRFYTAEGGNTAWVYVRTSAAGNKFLQTYADGAWRDNLLALNECS
jgi:hypothetical protein